MLQYPTSNHTSDQKKCEYYGELNLGNNYTYCTYTKEFIELLDIYFKLKKENINNIKFFNSNDVIDESKIFKHLFFCIKPVFNNKFMKYTNFSPTLKHLIGVDKTKIQKINCREFINRMFGRQIIKRIYKEEIDTQVLESKIDNIIKLLC